MNIEYQYYIVTILKANPKTFPEVFCLMLKFSNKINNKASSCGMIGMPHAQMNSTETVFTGDKKIKLH